MYYEIYDTDTRNLLIDADSLADALAVVRAAVNKHGPAAVATWLLIEDDEPNEDNGRRIAGGDDLARLAIGTPHEAATRHDD